MWQATSHICCLSITFLGLAAEREATALVAAVAAAVAAMSLLTMYEKY
jgi:hypothetical protein